MDLRMVMVLLVSVDASVRRSVPRRHNSLVHLLTTSLLPILVHDATLMAHSLAVLSYFSLIELGP